MKSTKIILFIIIAVMFLGGCSNIDSSNSLSKEEIEIQTMTKVQSDVNEIMGRDIDYVLENMGNPYSMTYSLSIDNFDKFKDLKDIEVNNIDLKNMEDIEIVSKGFLYPKYISDDKLDGSAIYIVFKDDKVSAVETCDFKNLDISQLKDDDSNVAISVYTDDENIDLGDIDEDKLQMYVGKEEDEILEIFKNEECKYYAFSDTNLNLKVYSINENEVLIIFVKDGCVEFISRENISDILSNFDMEWKKLTT